MKKVILFLILFAHCYIIIGQIVDHYQINIEGEQEMNGINYTKRITFEKTSGDWGLTTITLHDVPKVVSFANTEGISQSANANITLTNGATLVSIDEEIIGNNRVLGFIIEVDGSTFSQNTVELNISYSINKSVDLSNPIEFSDPFPFTVSNKDEFLEQSEYIPTNYPEIVEKSKELTKRDKNALAAIESVGRYMKGYIKDQSGLSDYGWDVFYTGVGDCDGQAHAMSALLRSIGIPTRMASGYIVDYGFVINLGYPFNPTMSWGGSGNGGNQIYHEGHAWLEAYFPNTGWVRCDPAQNSLFFGWANQIKHWEGNSSRMFTHSATISYENPSTAPTFSYNREDIIEVNGIFNTNLSMRNYNKFDGLAGDNVLFAANTKRRKNPTCIDCTPDVNTPPPPVLLSANIQNIDDSKYVHLTWDYDPSALYYVIYRCKSTETMTDAHYVTKTMEYENSYDDILDDLEPGGYKYAVAAVNYYGESYNSNELTVNVTCYDRLIQSKTYSAHALEEGCNIEMQNVTIQNGNYVFVKPREEFLITSDFTLEPGAIITVEQ
ncbi:MAG: transglutaminase domain-containing protein [Cyclobacteriaceae bacterium]